MNLRERYYEEIGIMMIRYKKLKTTFIFIFLLFILLPYKGYAYLDPGTGSFFLQLAIAALLGVLYAVKLFWKNIKTFFKNIFFKERKNEKIEK